MSEKKKIDVDKLREEQRHPLSSGPKRLKDVLGGPDSNVLGPLFIGPAIAMVGLILEHDPLSSSWQQLDGYGHRLMPHQTPS